MKYFDDDIYLVHLSFGGIGYCRIHMGYTSRINFKEFIFVPVTADSGSNDCLQYLCFQFYHIPTIIFIWSHTIRCWKIAIVNKLSQVVLFIWVQLFRILNIITTMPAYTIYYYCYCLCILGHKFYCFVDSIKHHQEQRGKCIFFLTHYNWHTIRLIPLFWCPHLHT